MVISVREIFSQGGLFELFALVFTSKQSKKQKFTVHKAPGIDKIDKPVGLNILPPNFIENVLPPK